jgi:hypothetical protein
MPVATVNSRGVCLGEEAAFDEHANLFAAGKLGLGEECVA